MKECPLCGKPAEVLTGRWYQYDNGEQFIQWVCDRCVALHDELVAR